ncbi:sigma-70 family RNA polymerase sigma factor [Candidatus Poribacteria bacterium]|nr:sigma-70 family RNA polymerase sigma factor [Candidatus Poribacteria bacterium]MYA99515.1 sigma-70 family RNA polymerase sigma factor [Candidatus Poribacteria bacterium]
MSDGELVAAYRKGDKNAWDILCKRYTDKLFGFFVNETGNYEDAKDLVQETLIEAMVNLSTLQKPESFKGWLYRIRGGILAKYFRDRYKWGIHEPIDDSVLETRAPYAAPTDQQPEHLVIAQEHLDIVHNMVNRLPKSEREVFLLKFADPEMPQKEIAKTLRISVNAVKTRWRRGKQNLRKQLEAKYPGEFTYLFE